MVKKFNINDLKRMFLAGAAFGREFKKPSMQDVDEGFSTSFKAFGGDQEGAEGAGDSLALILDLYKVIAVLGAGIGSISVPAGFFALWNDTMVKAESLMRENDIDANQAVMKMRKEWSDDEHLS